MSHQIVDGTAPPPAPSRLNPQARSKVLEQSSGSSFPPYETKPTAKKRSHGEIDCGSAGQHDSRRVMPGVYPQNEGLKRVKGSDQSSVPVANDNKTAGQRLTSTRRATGPGAPQQRSRNIHTQRRPANNIGEAAGRKSLGESVKPANDDVSDTPRVVAAPNSPSRMTDEPSGSARSNILSVEGGQEQDVRGSQRIHDAPEATIDMRASSSEVHQPVSSNLLDENTVSNGKRMQEPHTREAQLLKQNAELQKDKNAADDRAFAAEKQKDEAYRKCEAECQEWTRTANDTLQHERTARKAAEQHTRVQEQKLQKMKNSRDELTAVVLNLLDQNAEMKTALFDCKKKHNEERMNLECKIEKMKKRRNELSAIVLNLQDQKSVVENELSDSRREHNQERNLATSRIAGPHALNGEMQKWVVYWKDQYERLRTDPSFFDRARRITADFQNFNLWNAINGEPRKLETMWRQSVESHNVKLEKRMGEVNERFCHEQTLRLQSEADLQAAQHTLAIFGLQHQKTNTSKLKSTAGLSTPPSTPPDSQTPTRTRSHSSVLGNNRVMKYPNGRIAGARRSDSLAEV
ncbi:hypothetical protein LTR36_005101 [Oleoguttula mirabilis]|uniref:Uncharacterized protein n=1 Tax=Oleoguttula mirabilis TaxID=1507867 RepID=A0AAV9JW34_9PEZI|nr:hypothetical protein LTR36_005101 [Oleoguttula mirabilis]